MRVFSRMKRFSTVSMHDQTLLGFFFSSIAESFDVFAILAVERDTRYISVIQSKCKLLLL